MSSKSSSLSSSSSNTDFAAPMSSESAPININAMNGSNNKLSTPKDEVDALTHTQTKHDKLAGEKPLNASIGNSKDNNTLQYSMDDVDSDDDDFDANHFDKNDFNKNKDNLIVNEPNMSSNSAVSNQTASKTLAANISDTRINTQHTVDFSEAGQRIDKLAASLMPEQSRAQIQEWLKSEQLTVNSEAVKAKYRVKQGDTIKLQATLQQHGDDEPENIPLDIVYEDESVVVINKPVGMVVHPGAGNWTGTLVNALLYHYPNQAHLPRAGLVHRIDKDTSGLLVIGKTKAAQLALQAQLKDKSVYRHYRCVVAGDAASLMRQRVIDAPIGRHRVQRTKMSVTSTGKDAVTHLIDITALSQSYCLVDVKLETGRTHQIRVHLSHIGHPLVGDAVYGKRQQLRAGISDDQRQAVVAFPRQALHAYKLGFIHPETEQHIEVTAPMPKDMLELIAILKD